MGDSVGGAFVVGVALDGDGAHPAARASRGAVPASAIARMLTARALLAERAGLAFLSFEDVRGASSTDAQLDAVQRAAFLAPLTRSIGLVATVDALRAEPFHLSAQLASLDIASRGRAGWIVRADDDVDAAAELPWEPAPGDAMVGEARDVVAVVRALWDSWEDDAVIRDAPTGRYLDRERLHSLDVTGERFSVAGPSIVPRPAQGQPVVLAAGGVLAPGTGNPGEGGHEGAADIVLLEAEAEQGIGELARAARASPAPAPARLIAELEVVLDTEDATAAERLALLDRAASWRSTGRARYRGGAAGLIALLERLATVVDGVRLHPAVIDDDLPVLATAVLPFLRERELTGPSSPETTLRGVLGLERPVNRFEAARLAVGVVSGDSS